MANIADLLDGPIVAVDVETKTDEGFGLDPTHPTKSGITSVAFYGDGMCTVIDDTNEKRLLRMTAEVISELDGLVATWNGANFDIAFLLTRAEICGVDLGIRAELSERRRPKYDPIPGHAGGYEAVFGKAYHVDVMNAWRPWAKAQGIRAGLKPVAQAHGLEVIEVDRERMHLLTPAERAAYNISDVWATYELARQAGAELAEWIDFHNVTAAA